MEAEAVLTMLRRVHYGEWAMIGSDMLELEIDLAPTAEKKERVMGFPALRTDRIEGARDESTDVD